MLVSMLMAMLFFAPPDKSSGDPHPAVQRLQAANDLANENSDEAVRALSMALQGFLMNAESFVDDAGALELRALTQLNLVRALLAGGHTEEANDAMDEAIRSALGKPLPARRLGPVVAELYEARLAASNAAGHGGLSILCEGECMVLVNERTIRGTRVADLPLGTYRVYAIRRDFGAKFRTEATITTAGAVETVRVPADFDASSLPTSLMSAGEYLRSLNAAMDLARVAPEDGIGPLLLLLADSPKYTEMLAADPTHQTTRQRALLTLAMAYLAVGDRDAAAFALDEAIRNSFDNRSAPHLILDERALALFEERKQQLESQGRAEFSIACSVDCHIYVFVNEHRVEGPVSLLQGSYRIRILSDDRHVDSVVDIDCGDCEVRRIFDGTHLVSPAIPRGSLDDLRRGRATRQGAFARPELATGGFTLIGMGAVGGAVGTIGFGVAAAVDRFWDFSPSSSPSPLRKGVYASIGAGVGTIVLGAVLLALADRDPNPTRRKSRTHSPLGAEGGLGLQWRF